MYVFVADLLILTDVFEAFRDVSMTQGKYKIDTAQYVSTTQIFWDAMLKKTGVELDLISDPAMKMIIESGMREVFALEEKRYAKANNNALCPLYDSTKPSTFISYLDRNNRSVWAMYQIQHIRESDNVIA